MYKDIEIIKGEIKYLLDSLVDQYESIDNQGDDVLQIDVDLFRKNVLDLYESTRKMHRLFHKSEPDPPTQVEHSMELAEVAPIRFSIMPEPSEIREVSPTPEPIVPPLEKQLEAEPPVQISPEILPPPAATETTPSPTLDLFAETATTLGEKYKSEKKALNELHHKEQKNLAGKINQKPLPDIKLAIGINEKFNFINEIFKGSLQEYNSAIQQLNSLPDEASSHAFIQNLMVINGLDEKNEALLKLKELISKKFLSL